MKKRCVLTGLALLAVSCQPKATAEEWATVRRGDLELGVECTGKLVALDSDALGPPPISDKWEFKIAMMAPEGEEVKKGEPVLAFDPTDLKQRLDTKQNERDAIAKETEKAVSNAQITRRDEELRIAEADAHVRKATLKLDRPEDLTASIELATARLDLELAKAELVHEKAKASAARRQDDVLIGTWQQRRARAEARIRETEADIDRMTVKAPRDATVIYVADPDDGKKKVGDTAWRQERVIETATLDRMIAKADVDEVDASKPVVGQHVAIHLEAMPDVTYGGTISAIGNIVQRQSKKNPLKVVRLTIALDKTDGVRMRPGMRFRGAVETGRVAAAILVPTNAVFLTATGPVAYRKGRSGYETVPLHLGKRNATWAEVRDGLAAGDEVSRVDRSREGAR